MLKKQLITLRNLVSTTLITGDSEMTGKAVGEQLGIDEVIANVMPEDKSRIIEEQKKNLELLPWLEMV